MFSLPPLPPSFDACLRDVHSQKFDFRHAAATQLGKLALDDAQSIQAEHALRSLLVDKHFAIQKQALLSLCLLIGVNIQPEIQTFLASTHLERVHAGLSVLWTFEDHPDVAETLALPLLEHDQDLIQRHAAHVLGQRGSAASVEALFSQLNNSEDLTDLTALKIYKALGAIQIRHNVSFDDAQQEMLASLLSHPNDNVRIEISILLASCNDKRAVPMLLQAAQTCHPRAASALADLNVTEACDVMARAMGQGIMRWLRPMHPWTRISYAVALHRLGDPRGVNALVQILKSRNASHRHHAIVHIKQHHITEMLPALEQLHQQRKDKHSDKDNEHTVIEEAIDALKTSSSVESLLS